MILVINLWMILATLRDYSYSTMHGGHTYYWKAGTKVVRPIGVTKDQGTQTIDTLLKIGCYVT